jgi:hypothetical protein
MKAREEPTARLHVRMFGIAKAAWHEARQRGGRSTIGAVVLSVAGAVLAFVILHRSDAGGVVVQVTLAALVLLAIFITALIAISARVERDRDRWRTDFTVLQRRIAVTNTTRDIARDCRLELDKPSGGPVEDQKLLDYYVERSLAAARSDKYANIDRIRELEAFLDNPAPDQARTHLESLEALLRQNVYDGVYLRP